MAYLVRLPNRPQTSATRAGSDGLSPHLIRVHLRNIVELVLERLASSILTSARDLANTGSFIQYLLEIRSRELKDGRRFTIIRVLAFGALGRTCLELGWQVAVNDGERLGVNTREG